MSSSQITVIKFGLRKLSD